MTESIKQSKPASSANPTLLHTALRTLNHLRCKSWDFMHGVETSGEIPLTSLDFKSEHKNPGLEYQSHHPRILQQIISAIDIQHDRFTFIDYGCGKGRVLLVASEFPFRRIVGVEFAPQLAQAAERNWKTSRRLQKKCKDVTVLTMDATEYQLPPDPLVLFFYSPFVGTVMQKVVENIECSFHEFPREIFILFTGIEPMRDRAFGSRPQCRRLRREKYFDVYKYSA
jgi:SAM-dependent methyltransferase